MFENDNNLGVWSHIEVSLPELHSCYYHEAIDVKLDSKTGAIHLRENCTLHPALLPCCAAHCTFTLVFQLLVHRYLTGMK